MFNVSVKDQAQTLANFLRSDRLFRAKNLTDTNLRKMLVGLAFELGRIEGTANDLLNNYDITTGTNLLSEWEQAIGIPDNCFTVVSTNTQRSKNILTKLSALGVSTKAGFEALAVTFGYTINIYAGADWPTFVADYPMLNKNFTLVVEMDVDLQPDEFAYYFPLTFGVFNYTNIIQCLFALLVPSNTTIVYNYITMP